MPPFLVRLRLIIHILTISTQTGVEVISLITPVVRAIARAVREFKK